MSEYHAPVKEMLFVLRHLADMEAIGSLPGHEDASMDLVEAVLTEAAQLAGNVIAPTNRVGDLEGTRVEEGRVVVPAEFTAAYKAFIEGGWSGLALNPEYGGQGLPYVLGIAVEEMWQSANLAWSLGPLLTQGAARAIEAHGSAALKTLYLSKMVSGEWSGTMNLTEPQAGSDLSAIRSQAVPDGDGYRVSGQKIFITWGDHDMTENVVHLVLARLPDAPPGTRGISLFLVPKFIPDANGDPGEKNTVYPVSVEHKLGIHGSPTCVMAFENAVGYLVGEVHRGLACMFTMMNHARLGVGMEGIAIAERAYQQALAYARERIQGRVPGVEGRAAIIHHADVRRMLLAMKSQIEAMRGLGYAAGASLDFAQSASDPELRARHQARVELLTPVVKGWCTETGEQLTSLALQIHGGMGYVEETGAAQHFRDARITTIYEGTTGIQAADLVGRKILRDGGTALADLIADMRGTLARLGQAESALAVVHDALQEGVEQLEIAAVWLAKNHDSHPAVPGAVSHAFLMLVGTVAGGWQLARAALAAREQLVAGSADTAFCKAKLQTARFYARQSMPMAIAWRRSIEAGAADLADFPEEQF